MTSQSYAEAAREAEWLLSAAGFDSDERVREIGTLARAWLGWEHATWLTRRSEPATDAFKAGLMNWAARRAAREPFAYITGFREFYGRRFHVTPDVLIPRPDTELLIDTALASLDELPGSPRDASRGDVGDAHQVAVMDIGTGSGCLAITLALERPDLCLVATDVSAGAIAVAHGNAVHYGVESRVTLLHQPLAAALVDAFDLIVANPPYVEERDRAALSPDVRDYEPPLALFGGSDGLAVIRELIPAAMAALRPGGRLLMEIGYGQADAVETLIVRHDLLWRGTRPDLAGIARVAVADKPSL